MVEKSGPSDPHEPVSIFAHKEREVNIEAEKASFEFTGVVNSLVATHGVEAGQHAVDFLRGYNEFLLGMTTLPSHTNVRDVMAGIAENLKHEVEDTLAVYSEGEDE